MNVQALTVEIALTLTGQAILAVAGATVLWALGVQPTWMVGFNYILNATTVALLLFLLVRGWLFDRRMRRQIRKAETEMAEMIARLEREILAAQATREGQPTNHLRQ